MAPTTTYRQSLNPANLARQIADLQNRLIVLAKDKTDQLYLNTIPSKLPHVRKGVRVNATSLPHPVSRAL